MPETNPKLKGVISLGGNRFVVDFKTIEADSAAKAALTKHINGLGLDAAKDVQLISPEEIKKLSLEDQTKIWQEIRRITEGTVDNVKLMSYGPILEETSKAMTSSKQFSEYVADRSKLSQAATEKHIDGIRKWNDLTPEQHKALLGDILKSQSGAYNMVEPKLVFADLPSGQLGGFDPKTNTVTLSNKVIAVRDPAYVIEVLTHEISHADQLQLGKKVLDGTLKPGQPLYDVSKVFASNIGTDGAYIFAVENRKPVVAEPGKFAKPNDQKIGRYDLYLAQPVEVGATNIAEDMTRRLEAIMVKDAASLEAGKTGEYKPAPVGATPPSGDKTGEYKPAPVGATPPAGDKTADYKPPPVGATPPAGDKTGDYKPTPVGAAPPGDKTQVAPLPPIRDAASAGPDNSKLHIYTGMNVPDADGKPSIIAMPVEAKGAIDPKRPTLIVLPGIKLHHGMSHSTIASVMAVESKMLGGPGLIGPNMDVATISYPDYAKDPEGFKKFAMNNDQGFSKLTEQLSTAIIGEVKDYKSMTPDQRAAEVKRLQETLRTKVVSGMSMGSYVADGLPVAMVHQLEQKGFPPDVITKEIMPNLKVVTHSSIGVQQRTANHKPTGVTALHVANHNDIALHMQELKNLGFIPLDTGPAEGTSKVKIGPNESMLMTTLPTQYSVAVPYDAQKHKNDYKLIVRDGQTFALVSAPPNSLGHQADAFKRPIVPAETEQGRLSYTEATGHATGNTLRGMMADATEAAKAIEAGKPLPPRPDINTLVEKPNPAMQNAATPERDPLVRDMKAVRYEDYMKSVSVDGEKGWKMSLAGAYSEKTPAFKASLDLLAKQDWISTNRGDERLFSLDLSKVPEADRPLVVAALREQGVTGFDLGNNRLLVEEGQLPKRIADQAKVLPASEFMQRTSTATAERSGPPASSTKDIPTAPIGDKPPPSTKDLPVPPVGDKTAEQLVPPSSALSPEEGPKAKADIKLVDEKKAIFDTLKKVRDGNIKVTPGAAGLTASTDVDMLKLTADLTKLQEAYPNGKWLDVPLIEGDPESTVRKLNTTLEKNAQVQRDDIQQRAIKAKEEFRPHGISEAELMVRSKRTGAINLIRLVNQVDQQLNGTNKTTPAPEKPATPPKSNSSVDLGALPIDTEVQPAPKAKAEGPVVRAQPGTEPEIRTPPVTSPGTQPDMRTPPVATPGTQPDMRTPPVAPPGTQPEVRTPPVAASPGTQPEIRTPPVAPPGTQPEIRTPPVGTGDATGTQVQELRPIGVVSADFADAMETLRRSQDAIRATARANNMPGFDYLIDTTKPGAPDVDSVKKSLTALGLKEGVHFSTVEKDGKPVGVTIESNTGKVIEQLTTPGQQLRLTSTEAAKYQNNNAVETSQKGRVVTFSLPDGGAEAEELVKSRIKAANNARENNQTRVAELFTDANGKARPVKVASGSPEEAYVRKLLADGRVGGSEVFITENAGTKEVTFGVRPAVLARIYDQAGEPDLAEAARKSKLEMSTKAEPNKGATPPPAPVAEPVAGAPNNGTPPTAGATPPGTPGEPPKGPPAPPGAIPPAGEEPAGKKPNNATTEPFDPSKVSSGVSEDAIRKGLNIPATAEGEKVKASFEANYKTALQSLTPELRDFVLKGDDNVKLKLVETYRTTARDPILVNEMEGQLNRVISDARFASGAGAVTGTGVAGAQPPATPATTPAPPAEPLVLTSVPGARADGRTEVGAVTQKNGKPLVFTTPPSSQDYSRFVPVAVDLNKVMGDAQLRPEPRPGMIGRTFPTTEEGKKEADRYIKIRRAMASGEIDMPELRVGPDGKLSTDSGNHRLKEFKAQGLETAYVLVPADQAADVQKRYGATQAPAPVKEDTITRAANSKYTGAGFHLAPAALGWAEFSEGLHKGNTTQMVVGGVMGTSGTGGLVAEMFERRAITSYTNLAKAGDPNAMKVLENYNKTHSIGGAGRLSGGFGIAGNGLMLYSAAGRGQMAYEHFKKEGATSGMGYAQSAMALGESYAGAGGMVLSGAKLMQVAPEVLVGARVAGALKPVPVVGSVVAVAATGLEIYEVYNAYSYANAVLDEKTRGDKIELITPPNVKAQYFAAQQSNFEKPPNAQEFPQTSQYSDLTAAVNAANSYMHNQSRPADKIDLSSGKADPDTVKARLTETKAALEAEFEKTLKDNGWDDKYRDSKTRNDASFQYEAGLSRFSKPLGLIDMFTTEDRQKKGNAITRLDALQKQLATIDRGIVELEGTKEITDPVTGKKSQGFDLYKLKDKDRQPTKETVTYVEGTERDESGVRSPTIKRVVTENKEYLTRAGHWEVLKDPDGKPIQAASYRAQYEATLNTYKELAKEHGENLKTTVNEHEKIFKPQFDRMGKNFENMDAAFKGASVQGWSEFSKAYKEYQGAEKEFAHVKDDKAREFLINQRKLKAYETMPMLSPEVVAKFDSPDYKPTKEEAYRLYLVDKEQEFDPRKGTVTTGGNKADAMVAYHLLEKTKDVPQADRLKAIKTETEKLIDGNLQKNFAAMEGNWKLDGMTESQKKFAIGTYLAKEKPLVVEGTPEQKNAAIEKRVAEVEVEVKAILADPQKMKDMEQKLRKQSITRYLKETFPNLPPETEKKLVDAYMNGNTPEQRTGELRAIQTQLETNAVMGRMIDPSITQGYLPVNMQAELKSFMTKEEIEKNLKIKVNPKQTTESRREFAEQMGDIVTVQKDMPAILERYGILPGAIDLSSIKPVVVDGKDKISVMISENGKMVEKQIPAAALKAREKEGNADQMKYALLAQIDPKAAMQFEMEKNGLKNVRFGKDEKGVDYIEVTDNRKYYDFRTADRTFDYHTNKEDSRYRIKGEWKETEKGAEFVTKSVQFKDKDGTWKDLKRLDDKGLKDFGVTSDPSTFKNRDLGQYGREKDGRFPVGGDRVMNYENIGGMLQELVRENSRVDSLAETKEAQRKAGFGFSTVGGVESPGSTRSEIKGDKVVIQAYVNVSSHGVGSKESAGYVVQKAVPKEWLPKDPNNKAEQEAFMRRVQEAPVTGIQEIKNGKVIRELDLTKGKKSLEALEQATGRKNIGKDIKFKLEHDGDQTYSASLDGSTWEGNSRGVGDNLNIAHLFAAIHDTEFDIYENDQERVRQREAAARPQGNNGVGGAGGLGDPNDPDGLGDPNAPGGPGMPGAPAAMPQGVTAVMSPPMGGVIDPATGQPRTEFDVKLHTMDANTGKNESTDIKLTGVVNGNSITVTAIELPGGQKMTLARPINVDINNGGAKLYMQVERMKQQGMGAATGVAEAPQAGAPAAPPVAVAATPSAAPAMAPQPSSPAPAASVAPSAAPAAAPGTAAMPAALQALAAANNGKPVDTMNMDTWSNLLNTLAGMGASGGSSLASNVPNLKKGRDNGNQVG